MAEINEVNPDGVSNVADVALPQVLVTLKHLRTHDGGPVAVMCDSLDELTLAALTAGLPGTRVGASVEDAVAAAGGMEEVLKLTDARAQVLIESATWLAGPDGEVRPAFWFDPSKPRHARSIPGRLLKYEDRVALLTGVMSAGRYLKGETAEAISFPVHGEGVHDGVGAGTSGEPDGNPGPSMAGLHPSVMGGDAEREVGAGETAPPGDDRR